VLNRPHRLGHRLALRHQHVDLPELRDDLLRLVLLLGIPSRLERIEMANPRFLAHLEATTEQVASGRDWVVRRIPPEDASDP
jgi:hypothetical protein